MTGAGLDRLARYAGIHLTVPLEVALGHM